MRGFQIIMPVVLGVLGLVMFTTFDFVSRAKAAPAGLTVSQYVTDLPRRGMVALRGMQTESTLDIAAYLPQAPEGWTSREMRETDVADITGIAPVARDPEGVEEALEDNVMFQVVAAQQTRGFQEAGNLYSSPTGSTIVHLNFVPAHVFNGIGGAQMGMMVDMMAFDFETTEFTRADGVRFGEKPIDGPNLARDITAKIGRQVDIRIVSDDSDEAILALIGALDMPALNSLLAEPMPGIGTEAAPEPEIVAAAADTPSLAAFEKALAEAGGMPAAAADFTDPDFLDQLIHMSPEELEALSEEMLETLLNDPAFAGADFTIDGAPASDIFGALFEGAAGAMDTGPAVEGEMAIPAAAAAPVAEQARVPVIRRGAQGGGGFASNCQRNRGVKTCTVGGN